MAAEIHVFNAYPVAAVAAHGVSVSLAAFNASAAGIALVDLLEASVTIGAVCIVGAGCAVSADFADGICVAVMAVSAFLAVPAVDAVIAITADRAVFVACKAGLAVLAVEILIETAVYAELTLIAVFDFLIAGAAFRAVSPAVHTAVAGFAAIFLKAHALADGTVFLAAHRAHLEAFFIHKAAYAVGALAADWAPAVLGTGQHTQFLTDTVSAAHAVVVHVA
jgi:hypothetical protein